MSTLRISNIEAKADSSSPTVDEQLRFTNSDGDLMLYLDGRTAGITTVGINTTNQTIKFDANNNVMVTGIITATEFHGSLAVGTSVTYGDDEKAYFGTGLDLEIYHSPSDNNNSFIKHTGAGALKIAADHFRFRNAADNSNILNGITGGAVTLYFAGNEKLKTTSDGIEVPDAIRHLNDTNTAIRFPANDTISFETAGTEKLQIDSGGQLIYYSVSTQAADFGTGAAGGAFHKYDLGAAGATIGYLGSANNLVTSGNVADFVLRGQGNMILAAGGGTERLRIASNGDMLLGAHGSRIFDDSSGTNVVVDIYGGTTAGKRGILALGGRTGSDDADIGTIQFLNENNANATAANHVQSKLVALIDVKSETTNSNASANSGGHLIFSTKAQNAAIAERLRITSTGKVLIGHDTPIEIGVGAGYQMPLQVIGTSYDTSGMVLARYANDGNGPTLAFVKSRNATKGSQTIVQANDNLGMIRFLGSDGTDTQNAAARIRAFCDTTPASNKIPGRIVFETTSTLQYAQERMRIDSAGRVVIGGELGNAGASGLYIGGAALAVLGTGYTPNTYSCFAMARVGTNVTNNTPIANIRLNAGPLGTGRGAEINAYADANWSDASSHPTRLTFHTVASGSTGSTERLRINSSGVITLGTSTNTTLKAEICNSVSGHYFVSQCSDNNNGFEIYQQHGSTTTRNTLAVYNNSTGSKHLNFYVRGDNQVWISTVKNNTALVLDGTSSGTAYGETGGRIEFLMLNEVNQFTGNFAARISPYLQRGNNGFGLKFDVRHNASTTYKALDLTADYEVLPGVNGSIDLGNASYRWKNVYTNDLQLSNEGNKNDVDGTWGNYTIQEGESDLFLINNRSGKKYKFNLTEVS